MTNIVTILPRRPSRVRIQPTALYILAGALWISLIYLTVKHHG